MMTLLCLFTKQVNQHLWPLHIIKVFYGKPPVSILSLIYCSHRECDYIVRQCSLTIRHILGSDNAMCKAKSHEDQLLCADNPIKLLFKCSIEIRAVLCRDSEDNVLLDEFITVCLVKPVKLLMKQYKQRKVILTYLCLTVTIYCAKSRLKYQHCKF